MILNAANNASANLTQEVLAEDVIIHVDDYGLFPTPPFLVSVGAEIMLVTELVGESSLEVMRGQEGTVALNHVVLSNSGDRTKVDNRLTAGTYEAINIRHSDLVENIGSLNNLITEEKDTIVGAINEAFGSGGSGDSEIVDSVTDKKYKWSVENGVMFLEEVIE